jgi:SulP family sulfate permease
MRWNVDPKINLQMLQSGRLFSILTTGLLVGLLEIILAVSFGTLVFSGSLTAFVPQGVGLAILGMALSGAIIAFCTSLPGIVGGSQSAPAVIMAVAVAGIAAVMPASATTKAAFVTTAVAIALSTAITGLFLLSLGLFRLGNLGRFLPYPVMGGFLAGTGWLLILGGIMTMVSLPQGSSVLPALFQADTVIFWLPGLLLAAIMLLLLRKFDHSLLFPALVLAGVVFFYLITWLSGVSLAELNSQGWLLGPFPEGSLWTPFAFSDLALVEWAAIMSQAASLLPILLVSAVSLLLNAGGIELFTRRNIDPNQELRAAGLANLASSLAAGLVGYQQISLSALNFKGQAQSRLVGLIAAGLCILAMFAGAAALSLFPKVIIGALLLYLGLTFLVEWVVESWFTMAKIDYFIVIFILLVTAIVGFMEAVALGLIVAIVLFVVGLSRVDVVRYEMTETTYPSRVVRSRQHRQLLEQEEGQVVILELQDFIFFGTADSLFKRIRDRFDDRERPLPKYIILDFRRVTGIDSTAMLSFTRFQHLAESKGFNIVYTGTSAQVRRQLEQSVAGNGQAPVYFVASLEKGVEACEDQILQQARIGLLKRSPSLAEQLAEIIPDAEYLPEILSFFEEMEVEAGDYLIRQGDVSRDLFFVQEGQVTTLLEQENGEPIRLGTIGGGVVGEIGFYLGQRRTASVVADGPSKLYRLTRENMQRLQRENPQAAANMHCLVAHLLSERVAHLVRTVHALEH